MFSNLKQKISGAGTANQIVEINLSSGSKFTAKTFAQTAHPVVRRSQSHWKRLINSNWQILLLDRINQEKELKYKK